MATYCTSGDNEYCNDPRDPFPDFNSVPAHSHRGSFASQSYPYSPTGFRSDFDSSPSQEIQESMMAAVQDSTDPRYDIGPMFNVPSLGSSAPTPNRMHRPSGSEMSRSQSFQHAFPEGYNDTSSPVPRFLGQPPAGGMTFQAMNGDVGPPLYRPAAPPGSYTESTRSRDQRSQRSSNASNFPPTPSSEYTNTELDMGLPGLHLGQSGLQFDNRVGYNASSMQTAHSGAAMRPEWDTSPVQEYYSAPAPVSPMGPPQSSPMARQPSSQNSHRPSKKREFWCQVPNCTHNRAFGTRNDLDRHKLAVHKIVGPNSNIKVYVCQGPSCLQQGKNKVWPRKDNFKNHCKVAHTQVDAELDDLIQRSERPITSLKKHEIEGLQAEDDAAVPSDYNLESAPLSGKLSTLPQLRVSLEPTSRINRDVSKSIPVSPSSAHLSPVDARRSSFSRPTSASSQVTTIAHRRSVSAPDVNAQKMSRGSSDPNSSSVHSGLSSSTPANIEELRAFLLKNDAPEHLIDGLSLTSRLPKRKREEYEANNGRQQKCQWPGCTKSFKRPCDLKKHFARHKRPWGCTDSSCHQLFGSKNDWKRHEHSRHFQLETWICGERVECAHYKRCTKTFETPNEFRTHLRSEHAINDTETLRNRSADRRVGRNWSGAFWCGYCRNVIPLIRKNQEAWDERFDHIDTHFFAGKFRPSEELKAKAGYERVAEIEGEAFTADQWVPPTEDCCKRQLAKTVGKQGQFGAISSQPSTQSSFDDDMHEGDVDGEDAVCDEDLDDGDGSSEDSNHDTSVESVGAPEIPIKRTRRYVRWTCRHCRTDMDSRHHVSCIMCHAQKIGGEETKDYYSEIDD